MQTYRADGREALIPQRLRLTQRAVRGVQLVQSCTARVGAAAAEGPCVFRVWLQPVLHR
jgi:hypothetical protein